MKRFIYNIKGSNCFQTAWCYNELWHLRAHQRNTGKLNYSVEKRLLFLQAHLEKKLKGSHCQYKHWLIEQLTSTSWLHLKQHFVWCCEGLSCVILLPLVLYQQDPGGLRKKHMEKDCSSFPPWPNSHCFPHSYTYA